MGINVWFGGYLFYFSLLLGGGREGKEEGQTLAMSLPQVGCPASLASAS